MKEASHYLVHKEEIVCGLCPHNCIILHGKTGKCKVRRHMDGKLITENYGRISSLHLDPIEKKPFYHFYPGSTILSAGSVGCNMKCKYCQNSQISQCGMEDLPLLSEISPLALVQKAKETTGNLGLAFTYNEPIVWFEYVLDTARLAHEHGLKNVMVTNGFIEEDPLRDLLPWIDAFNVDLKAFTPSFYQAITFSSLQPVLNSLQLIRKSEKHLEITFLVIPGLNDIMPDFTRMLEWISINLGKNIPLHLSRYYPMHQLNRPPTPIATLLSLYETAKSYLDFVYLGNVGYQEVGHDTICPSCNSLVIHREGYLTTSSGMDNQGRCLQCQSPIAKV